MAWSVIFWPKATVGVRRWRMPGRYSMSQAPGGPQAIGNTDHYSFVCISQRPIFRKPGCMLVIDSWNHMKSVISLKSHHKLWSKVEILKATLKPCGYMMSGVETTVGCWMPGSTRNSSPKSQLGQAKLPNASHEISRAQDGTGYAVSAAMIR